MSADLTSKHARRAAGLFLALTAGAFFLPASASAAERFRCRPSAQVFDDALSAYQRGDFTSARKRFECLISQGDDLQKFYSTFYLGRVHGDNNGGETNHERALTIYSDFIEQYSNVDPDDLRRAPFVAKTLTAVGLYTLRGSTEAGTKVDAAKAAEFLRRAAVNYDEPDAQFELSKLLLVGDGVKQDTELALHYLQKLSQESHAGAQAFLADLMWRGKFLPAQKVQAFALIQLALENATSSDRLWIEEIYQHIYCGLGEGVRNQSTGLVGAWRRQFVKPVNPVLPAPPMTELSPDRTCSSGEAVIFPPPRTPGMRRGDTADGSKTGAVPIGRSTLSGDPQNR